MGKDGKWSPTGKPVVPKKDTHLRPLAVKLAPERKRQGSRLPKNLFGEQVGGSSAGGRNPPKHARSITAMVAAGVTHSSTAKAMVSCVGG